MTRSKTTVTTTTATRPLYIIAREIRATWPRVNFAAVPYLQAMARLGTITDRYGADDAEEIVLRFLGNATHWTGPDARRIKSELREMTS